MYLGMVLTTDTLIPNRQLEMLTKDFQQLGTSLRIRKLWRIMFYSIYVIGSVTLTLSVKEMRFLLLAKIK